MSRVIGCAGEVWLSIPGYPDYSVSNEGRVCRVKAGRGAVAGRILQPVAGGGREREYLQVVLCRAGSRKTQLVHRLVAAAFLGTAQGRVVHHRDTNRANNVISNLAYVTQSHNIRESWHTRRAPST